MFRFFYVTVDDLYDVIGFGNIFCNIVADDFALIVLVTPFFLSSWSPISSWVQSAVSPLVRAEDTRGPKSRPMTVAPIRQI